MLLSLKGAGLGVGEVVIDTVYIDENQTSHFNTDHHTGVLMLRVGFHHVRTLLHLCQGDGHVLLLLSLIHI